MLTLLRLQLKELKQKLESDACAVAMLWALGGIIDELCTDVCLSVHRRHRFDLLGLDMQNGGRPPGRNLAFFFEK